VTDLTTELVSADLCCWNLRGKFNSTRQKLRRWNTAGSWWHTR